MLFLKVVMVVSQYIWGKTQMRPHQSQRPAQSRGTSHIKNAEPILSIALTPYLFAGSRTKYSQNGYISKKSHYINLI